MCLMEKKNSERRRQFFLELEGLMNRYDELFENDEEMLEHLKEAHVEEYDEGAPKIMNAVMVVYTTRNTDGWEDIFYVYPENQSRFHNVGMLTTTLELI